MRSDAQGLCRLLEQQVHEVTCRGAGAGEVTAVGVHAGVGVNAQGAAGEAFGTEASARVGVLAAGHLVGGNVLGVRLMLTGWLNVAVCQPLVDSLVKVTVASSWPAAVYSEPVCVPVLPLDL